MFVHDPALTELIFDYCRERLATDPVPLDFPGTRAALGAALEGSIGDGPHPPEGVLRLFEEHLSRAVISIDSPRFLAFIPGAPTKAALLFDMVVSASSLQGSSWLEAAGAVAAENQVLRLLADLAGLPASAGGVFVSGGSAGNLSALVVARDTAVHRLGAAAPARLRIACSDEAHSSVAKAAHVIGVGTLVVPTMDHRLTGDALEAALAADPDPASVAAVVATAGTTNAGIIDDLAGVSAVARRRHLWMHVDGAYGGAGLLSRRVRDRYAGIEHADSLVVDPHKWLFAPFDCAALLYRRPGLAKGVFTQDAAYLDVIHTGADQGDTPEEWNPSDYAYHLTRRARGLATWFSLAVHGLDLYRDAVDAAITVAERTAAVIEGAPHLELIRRPELSVVLFRRVGWGPDDYARWSDELLASQTGFVTPTRWEGETVARFAFLHPETTDAMVAEILATMV
jgi:aromatic-L-amino-acid decarboxylase